MWRLDYQEPIKVGGRFKVQGWTKVQGLRLAKFNQCVSGSLQQASNIDMAQECAHILGMI